MIPLEYWEVNINQIDNRAEKIGQKNMDMAEDFFCNNNSKIQAKYYRSNSTINFKQTIFFCSVSKASFIDSKLPFTYTVCLQMEFLQF